MSEGPLYCTTAPNDSDLLRELGSMAVALPITTGDVCFSGVGFNSTPLLVSCERKKIGDFCSCIADGRYLHQLQIAKRDGADVFVLIIEGEIRPSPEDGLLEIPVWRSNITTNRRAQYWEPVKPTTTYNRYLQYVAEVEYLVGVLVFRSSSVKETAAIILAIWDNFQTPPDDHNSLKQIFKPRPPTVPLIRPSLLQRVAAELKGVGWGRSKAVSQHFRSVREMVDAGEDEWLQIEGIGKKTASSVVRELKGEK